MLRNLSKVIVGQGVLRFANLKHVASFATQRGLSIDEVTEVIEFIREDVTKELIEGPFERKAPLGNKFGRPSRYSDGDRPVFYAAIERETAEKESSYHYGRKAAGDASARRSVHYSVVRCTFKGEIIDLRVKLAEWPDLVSEDYSFCNGLGKEAHGMELGGFLAPSCRHPGGTTVPTFLIGTLSSPVIVATVRLSYEDDSTVIQSKELPT